MTTEKKEQGTVAAEELQAAQKTVQALIAAFKSYSLYPEDHVFCRTNLERLTALLDSFLEHHGELSLAISKNSFLYEGETIYAGPPEESNPAYLLTRDGLVRLDFLKGAGTGEVTTLLRILNRHRSAGDESEGDIVISLWQAELQHIEYEEVDIFALEAFNFDLGSLSVTPEDPLENPPKPEMPWKEEAAGPENAPRPIAESTGEETESAGSSTAQRETVTNLLRMDQGLKVLELSPEEKSLLESYVLEEEGRDYTSDVIDVLLIILVSQKNKTHFNQVLEFLAMIFFDCLDRGSFHFAYKLCSNVLTIRNQIKSIRPWTLELVDHFLASLSAEEPWSELPWVNNTQLLVLYREHLNFLWHVLRLLTPEVILTLGPMMARMDLDNISLRNELHDIVENKAKKNPDSLSRLLCRADEKTCLLLFPIVEQLGRMNAAKICLQMTRHEAVEVRRTGLNGYLTFASPPEFEALFPVLNDEDDVIVGRLLTFLLSRAETEEAEALLLRFLEQAVAEGIDHAHMFEYYKALSQCGSFRSVKPLKKILMESRLTEMFSNLNAVHKKGAALALGILGTEEALDILRTGVRSMRPDIRLACQFALEKVQ